MNNFSDWSFAVCTVGMTVAVRTLIIIFEGIPMELKPGSLFVKEIKSYLLFATIFLFLCATWWQVYILLYEHHLRFSISGKMCIVYSTCWLTLKYINRPKKPRPPKKEKEQNLCCWVIRPLSFPVFKPT